MFTRLHSLSLFLLLAATPAFGQNTEKKITDDGGRPIGDNQNSRTAGPDGPVLLDNFHLIQKLARFDRERIPERVVHARGVGAHGEFVSYGDLSKYTKASLFSAKDKKTPVFMRFSTVVHPGGSPESLRDPRGFAVKFYTEEGNWDLVGNNLPVFFIRDAIKFPDMVHSFKPSLITNQQDPNRIFDFFSHVPECTHMMTFLYSDMGTPANLRQMDGFGVHAFKFVDAKGKVTYVKFNWRSQQGHATHSADEAAQATAKNHSNHTQDLYESIRALKFPSWELNIQVMNPEDLDKHEYDPLDDTKIWSDVEETPIGKLTLNKVPSNFFQFTEQAAFSPGMFVPGIEASEDRMLQGRLFSYADTQRYRIGANYLDLPVNRPLAQVNNNNQGGSMNANKTTTDINYEPSVDRERTAEAPEARESTRPLNSSVQQKRIVKTLDFKQAGALYKSFDKKMQDNLISNFTGDLKQVKNQQLQLRMVSFAFQADEEYGTRLAKALGLNLDDVKKIIEINKDTDRTKWIGIETK